MERMFEKLTIAIAWALPRSLVKWCAVRVMAHATTGKWGDQITPALLATDAQTPPPSSNEGKLS